MHVNTEQNRSSLDLKRREFKRVGMLGAGVAIADLSLQNSDGRKRQATSEDALYDYLKTVGVVGWVHTTIKALVGLLIGFLEFVKISETPLETLFSLAIAIITDCFWGNIFY